MDTNQAIKQISPTQPTYIDGFISPKNYTPSIISPNKATKRSAANHLIKKPLPAKTLMRKAVVKPKKPLSKAFSPISGLEKNSHILSVPMAGRADPELVNRSQAVRLSTKISRFGSTVTHDQSQSGAVYQPTVDLPRTSSQQKPPTNIFDAALEKAKSHEQPALSKKELKRQSPPKLWRKKAISYSAVGILAVAVLSYGLYSAMPSVMIKVASVRAGFAAVLPAYAPSGFTMSKINYGPGKVLLNYSSNLDGRHFSIAEHSSNWDSATLLSSIITPLSGTSYREISFGGQSIYLYGHNQAAWVSNGIWYQVTGDNGLSVNDIEQLASTL